MADSIDNLKIQIGADSKNAKDKIDSLVDSLAKLRMSLAGLDSASVNVSGINNAVSSFRNLGDAIKSVDTRQLGSISRSLMKVAKAGSVLSSASKGFSVLKANTKGLGELANVSTKKSTDEIEHEIQELSLLRDAANDTKETLRSMLDGLYIPSDFFKELGDDAKALRGYIGIGNTSYSGVAGANEVRNALQMAGEDAEGIYNDTEAYIRLARVLQHASDRATECERQIADLNSQLRASKDDLMDMGDMGADLSEWEILSGAMDDTAQSAQNLGNVVQTVEGQNPFEGLVESLRGFSGLTIPAESIASITGLSNAVIRLNSVGGDPGAVLTSISNGLRGFGGDIQLPNLNGMAEFIKSLGKLSGKRVQSAVTSLPLLGEGLRKLSALGDIQMPNSENIINFANALNLLGRKKVTDATNNIPKLTTALQQMMRTLSNAPVVSKNVIDMTNALANLGSQGGKMGAAMQSLTSRSGFPKLTNHFNRASKSGKGLAAVIGKVYATYWLLFRAFGLLKKSIDISADVTEVQNVVDHTFGQYSDLVEELSKTSIPEFGMNELTVKKTASRFQAMGKSMGIQNEAVKRANEYLAKSGAIYDATGDKMANMSIELTKLTGDLASFYNVEQDVVSEKLASIFTGQTRPLREFGMDLTQATLQEWALNNGINANVKTMSQAEKTMLRYQYVMSRSKDIMGDFSRTSDTWANQVRVLKQNFQQLGKVIGTGLINALKPALRGFNAFLQKVIAFAEMVVNALGKIFGWELEVTARGISDDLGVSEDAVGGLADDAGNAAGGLGDAAKNAKDLKEQLMGFDKLNVITTDKGGSGGGSGGSGGGSGSGGGGGGAAGEDGSVQASLKKTKSLFESEIDSLEELGRAIADALSDAMEDINWDKIYEKARKFGTGLADFLNGLFTGAEGERLFKNLGKTVAGAVNTVFNAGEAFADRFKFGGFGKALAQGIKGFLTDWDAGLTGRTFGKFVGGLANTLYAVVSDKENWVLLGQKIADGVNGALEGMNKIDKKTGLSGWEALGGSIAESLNGIVDTVSTALSNIKWGELAKGIGKGLWKFFTSLEGDTIVALIGTALIAKKAKLIGKSIGAEMGKSLAIPTLKLVIDKITTTLAEGALVAITGGSWANWIASLLGVPVGAVKIAMGGAAILATVAVTIGLAMKKEHDENPLETEEAWRKRSDRETSISNSVKNNKNKTEAEKNPTQYQDARDKAVNQALQSSASSYKVSVKAEVTSWSDKIKGDKTIDNYIAQLTKSKDKIKTSRELIGYLAKIGNFKDDIHKKRLLTEFIAGLNNTTDSVPKKKKKLTAFMAILTDKEDKISQKKLAQFTAILGEKDDKIKEKKLKDFIADLKTTDKAHLSKDDKTIQTTADFKKRTDNLSATEKTFNTKADFKSRIDDLATTEKTFGTKAKFNSRQDSLSSDEKTFYSKANFTKYTDSIKGSKTLGGFTAKIVSFIDDIKNKVISFFGGKKALGGAFYNDKWHNIAQYAGGGLPSHGTIFAAGERGAEVVGHIGGRTEVLNQSQLAAVMYDSVANATSNCITPILGRMERQERLLDIIARKEFGISADDLFSATRSKGAEYARRTGQQAFVF